MNIVGKDPQKSIIWSYTAQKSMGVRADSLPSTTSRSMLMPLHNVNEWRKGVDSIRKKTQFTLCLQYVKNRQEYDREWKILVKIDSWIWFDIWFYIMALPCLCNKESIQRLPNLWNNQTTMNWEKVKLCVLCWCVSPNGPSRLSRFSLVEFLLPHF